MMIRVIFACVATLLAIAGCASPTYDRGYWGGISKQIHDREK